MRDSGLAPLLALLIAAVPSPAVAHGHGGASHGSGSIGRSTSSPPRLFGWPSGLGGGGAPDRAVEARQEEARESDLDGQIQGMEEKPAQQGSGADASQDPAQDARAWQPL